jgi:hypothetical protein
VSYRACCKVIDTGALAKFPFLGCPGPVWGGGASRHAANMWLGGAPTHVARTARCHSCGGVLCTCGVAWMDNRRVVVQRCRVRPWNRAHLPSSLQPSERLGGRDTIRASSRAQGVPRLYRSSFGACRRTVCMHGHACMHHCSLLYTRDLWGCFDVIEAQNDEVLQSICMLCRHDARSQPWRDRPDMPMRTLPIGKRTC